MTDPRDDTPGDELEPQTGDADLHGDELKADELETADLEAEDLEAEDLEAAALEAEHGTPAPARDRRDERAVRPGRAAPVKVSGRPAKAMLAIDPALRIRDRASAIFVAGSTLVFLGIFLYAMAFGRGGAFTPARTPTPVVSPSPGASPLLSPSPAASPAASPGASPTPAISPAASPAASA